MLARKGTVKEMTSFFKTPGSNLTGREKDAFEEIKECIDQCTNEFLQQPNWDLNLKCCDMLAAEPSMKVLSQATFSLRRKIGLGSKHVRCVSLTLALIETLVKNGGMRLHAAIGTNFFMMEMAKVAKKYSAKSGQEYQVVAEQALDMIQAWGEAFTPYSKQYPYYVSTYYELRKEGLPFKAKADPARAPILDNSQPGGTPAAAPGGAASVGAGGGAGSVGGVPQGSFQHTQEDEQLLAAIASSMAEMEDQRGPADRSSMGSMSTYDGGRRTLPHAATSMDLYQSQGVPARSSTLSDLRTNEYVTSTSSYQPTYTGGSEYMSTYTTTTVRRPSLTRPPSPPPTEVVETLAQSLLLLREMINCSNTVDELRQNEIAQEMAQKIKELQVKLVKIIETSASVTDNYFTINEGVQEALWVYEGVMEGRITLIEAKRTMSPKSNNSSPSFRNSSTSAVTSSTTYSTAVRSTATGYVNEFNGYSGSSNSGPAAASPPVIYGGSGYSNPNGGTGSAYRSPTTTTYESRYESSDVVGYGSSGSGSGSGSSTYAVNGSSGNTGYSGAAGNYQSSSSSGYRAPASYDSRPASSIVTGPPVSRARPDMDYYSRAPPGPMSYGNTPPASVYTTTTTTYQEQQRSNASVESSPRYGQPPLPPTSSPSQYRYQPPPSIPAQSQPRSTPFESALPLYPDPLHGVQLQAPPPATRRLSNGSRSSSPLGGRGNVFSSSSAAIDKLVGGSNNNSANGYGAGYGQGYGGNQGSGVGYGKSTITSTTALKGSVELDRFTSPDLFSSNATDLPLVRVPASRLEAIVAASTSSSTSSSSNGVYTPSRRISPTAGDSQKMWPSNGPAPPSQYATTTTVTTASTTYTAPPSSNNPFDFC